MKCDNCGKEAKDLFTVYNNNPIIVEGKFIVDYTFEVCPKCQPIFTQHNTGENKNEVPHHESKR